MEHFKNYVSSLIVLALFGFICVVLQKLFPSISNQKWWLRHSKLNFYYWLFNTVIVTVFSASLVSILLTLTALVRPQLLLRINSTQLEHVTALSFTIAIIAIDFISYWLHRIFHSRKLWKFHAVHHSPDEIDWIASARFHPLESIIIVSTVYLLVITGGIGIKTVALAFSIRAAYGFIVHANLSWHYGPLGYIIASPYFHRWHHTKKKEGLNKNFAGLFSLWDFIFGTAYHPKSLQPHNFGVGQNIGESFWQQLTYPFRK